MSGHVPLPLFDTSSAMPKFAENWVQPQEATASASTTGLSKLSSLICHGGMFPCHLLCRLIDVVVPTWWTAGYAGFGPMFGGKVRGHHGFGIARLPCNFSWLFHYVPFNHFCDTEGDAPKCSSQCSWQGGGNHLDQMMVNWAWFPLWQCAVDTLGPQVPNIKFWWPPILQELPAVDFQPSPSALGVGRCPRTAAARCLLDVVVDVQTNLAHMEIYSHKWPRMRHRKEQLAYVGFSYFSS